MKEFFCVGENRFSVSVPEGLRSWGALMRRFGPFVCGSDGACVLEVEVETGELPSSVGEVVYEPEFDGIGFITSRARRVGDLGLCPRRSTEGLVVEFARVGEDEPRLWMGLSEGRARIVMKESGNGEDVYFLSHAIMIAYMMATTGNGTVLIHASAVVKDGRAYLFQGRSGTGKSTHSRMWLENVEGTELLNDDHPVIRFDGEGRAMAYGSPWSGKTHCYRNAGAEIGAFVRIVRGDVNELRRLDPLRGYASLTASVFYLPLLGEGERRMRHEVVERLAMRVPCCEMVCRPEGEAARVCFCGVRLLQAKV